MLPSETMQKAEKILANLKGLRERLQPDEVPLLNIPGIWDGDQGKQEQRSVPCDIVLTNQRLFGYFYATFPRQRLFLESISLGDITNISLREKKFEPVFRELLVSDGNRKIYIRAPHQKIESLYTTLRVTIEKYSPETKAAFGNKIVSENIKTSAPPIYGRQDIQTSFEKSSLGITILLIGGILLEIVAGITWIMTNSAQISLPLFASGFVAVITAILVRRQRR